MLDISIVSGLPRLLLFLLGPAALAALLSRRRPGWWTRRIPLAALIGAGTSLLVVLVVQVLWRPFPDPLPVPAVVYTGLTATALVLAVRRHQRWRRRALALLAVGAVAVSGAAQVNQQFQAYPTPRAVLGLPLPGQVPFSAVPTDRRPTVVPPAGTALSRVWRAPDGQRRNGAVTTVTIPGERSGFRARPAWLYLPPSYFSTPRPLLPVLVLIPGQPGTPRDWFDGGQLDRLLDRYAAAHRGLAPVVVVPDPLGSQLANPLCVDSAAGNAFSYLGHDVPAWIDRTLQVDRDRRHWAVGGVSAGATCALQLAVGRPQTFPTVLVLSGQREPTLGSRARTVRERFAGSAEAFRAANPLDILRRRRFPDSAALVAVGAQDARYRPQAAELADALAAAGVEVRRASAPGGHSWVVWRAVLTDELPWLGNRLGLTADGGSGPGRAAAR